MFYKIHIDDQQHGMYWIKTFDLMLYYSPFVEDFVLNCLIIFVLKCCSNMSKNPKTRLMPGYSPIVRWWKMRFVKRHIKPQGKFYRKGCMLSFNLPIPCWKISWCFERSSLASEVNFWKIISIHRIKNIFSYESFSSVRTRCHKSHKT